MQGVFKVFIAEHNYPNLKCNLPNNHSLYQMRVNGDGQFATDLTVMDNDTYYIPWYVSNVLGGVSVLSGCVVIPPLD